MGVTYRGQHSDSFGLSVKTNPSLLPEFSLSLQTIPGKRGVYYQKAEYRARSIPLEIGFVGESLSNYVSRLRALSEWLRPDQGTGEFIDDNEPDKTYYAVLSQLDLNRIEGISRMGKGSLVLLCPDPFAYGQTKTEQIGTSTDPNITIVTLFASQVSEYTTYAAPVSALPVFDVTFDNPSTEYRITHTESGKYVRVVYDFVAGDTLTIDHKTRKITINDVTHMTALDWANSEFFELVTGDNHFTITENVANTEITYEPRWL